MSKGRRFAACAVAALLAGWLCAGCAAEPREAPLVEARLWKRAQPPLELAPGDLLATGDELFMTVVLRRASYVYVVSEDAGGNRQILYPCRGWGQSPVLTSRWPHRLPPRLLGRETFWPVQSATPHERLLVLASARPAGALEGAVLAAKGTPPCAADLDGDASRWLDRLISANLGSGGASRDLRRGSWDTAASGQEGWMVAFDLAGLAEHG